MGARGKEFDEEDYDTDSVECEKPKAKSIYQYLFHDDPRFRQEYCQELDIMALLGFHNKWEVMKDSKGPSYSFEGLKIKRPIRKKSTSSERFNSTTFRTLLLMPSSQRLAIMLEG
jgi:hypothetical protein